MGHKLWLISDLISKKSEKFDFFEKMLPYFYVSVKNELKTKFRHFCLRIFEKLQKEIPNLKIFQKFELFGYPRNKVWDQYGNQVVCRVDFDLLVWIGQLTLTTKLRGHIHVFYWSYKILIWSMMLEIQNWFDWSKFEFIKSQNHQT